MIYRAAGIQRAVDVPDAVAQAFSDWDYPPVRVRVGDCERQTTMVPRGDGGLRLFVHTQLRRAAGVDTGESIALAVCLDDAPQAPWPEDVLEVAVGIDRGLEALELLPPGLRRQMLEFLGEAKRPATRRKRVDRIRELLEERAARLPAPD